MPINANDATSLVVPLWGAIVFGGGILSTVIGTIVWTFSNFERKPDAKERHDGLEERVSHQEMTLNKVANDVSYIRGRLEPRE